MEIIQIKDLQNMKGKWTRNFHIAVECQSKKSRECKKSYCIVYKTYYHHLKKNNGKIICQKCAQIGRYRNSVDETYFDIIDTPNKAYILGLLWADGSVDSRRLRLSLQEADKHILDEIKQELKYTGELRLISKEKILKWVQTDYDYKNQYSLEITCSPILCQRLLDLGFGIKHTRVENLPNIDDLFFWDFLRGFFDGDGCISSYKNNNCSTTTWQARISSISTVFKEFIKKKLQTYGMACYTSKHHLIIKQRKSLSIFLKTLYNHSELRFQRKYIKSRECLARQ